MRRRRVVRLGIPALLVGALALVALWRVGAPTRESSVVGTSGKGSAGGPLTAIADILTENAIGRQASLEDVEVREVTSARTFWLRGSGDDRAFAVLDLDVKNPAQITPRPGLRVTLVGLVRPSPTADDAVARWSIDQGTARDLEDLGTYLHVTEIREVRRGRL